MDNRLGRDLLSDLPVGIIESILGFLPVRDAIRTSMLSSKWRYRWTSLPQLVFDEDIMGFSTNIDASPQKHLENFITRTLFSQQGRIHKFKLHISNMIYGPKPSLWLLFLSGRDIKELILECLVELQLYLPLPPCLYSFKNLTFLMLKGCGFSPPPPAFKGFMNLRTLILQYVEAPSGAIESLVDNSPLLETLECTYVGHSGDSELRISAPNLKSFCIGNTCREIYLCAPLLSKMTVTLDSEDEQLRYWNWQKHSGCNYTKFLGGVTNLESLTGGGIFSECDSWELDGLKAPDINFWNSECPQNCTFRKLKVIKVTWFYGVLHELKFIEFLLQSSPVLETMIVEPLPFGAGTTEEYLTSQQATLDSAVELLSYCRASANAKILLKC